MGIALLEYIVHRYSIEQYITQLRRYGQPAVVARSRDFLNAVDPDNKHDWKKHYE